MTTTSPSEHSRFAPSRSRRWVNCPASMTLEEQAPREESGDSAREGSAAHKLNELRLCGVMTASGLTRAMGKSMSDLIPEGDPNKNTHDYLDVVVTEDMIEHVQEFLIWVRSQVPAGCSTLNRDIVRVEEPLVSPISNEIRGTADLVIIDDFFTLHVIDFKFGQGIQVDAEDNSQLAIYALAALDKFGDDFETVKMTIYQPRGGGQTVKTWEMPTLKFKETWTKKITRAHQECIEKPRLFRPGDWCKWCSGALNCDRAKRETKAMAKPSTIVPKEAKALARILNAQTAVFEYLNKVKAQAFEILNAGGEIPGYKLVKSFGLETWADEGKTGNILCDPRIYARCVNKPKLKTPKQIRKILGDEYPTALDDLTAMPYKGLVLVPQKDKRPAYTGPAEDFENVEIK